MATEEITTMSVDQELEIILEKWKKNDVVPLVPSTKLGELNIDSLDLVEVMFEIEEKFDVSLMQSHQDARQASFADLVGWIEQQLALQRSSAAVKAAMQPVKSTSRIADDELEKIPLPQ
jgi:acyl carrier protein